MLLLLISCDLSAIHLRHFRLTCTIVYALQRVFVMPNMDDIPIPLMCAHLQPDTEDDNDARANYLQI